MHWCNQERRYYAPDVDDDDDDDSDVVSHNFNQKWFHSISLSTKESMQMWTFLFIITINIAQVKPTAFLSHALTHTDT